MTQTKVRAVMKNPFPCRGCVTLAVGDGDFGCGPSTPKDFFSPCCDLWAADSAKCSVVLWPVKSS